LSELGFLGLDDVRIYMIVWTRIYRIRWF